MSFDNFNFNATISANIRDLGYVTPTPIQSQAIPHALAGRDLVGLAQTGTGKTAAFALPILQGMITRPAHRGVRTLVVAPTRELAEQIHEEFGKFGRHTHMRSATIYGGVSLKPQLAKLRAGVEIVIACPGRLLDHINQRTIDLSTLEFLVLDEADRMFDMGFLPDIRKILRHVPAKRQTLLFSATMPSDIRVLAGEALTDPVTVQIDIAKPTDTVTHGIYPVKPHLKSDLLMGILRETDTESVLVFTAAKHRAKRIAENLVKAGWKATSLQGNLSQGRRQEALNGFKNGTYQIMVATDVAARGIDVASISHVINFDMPDTLDAYTHRIGRTGRASKTGDAFTFVTDDDQMMVRSIENALKEKLERCYLPGFDYNVPPPAKDNTFARAPRPPRPRGPNGPKTDRAARPPGAAGPAPSSRSGQPRPRRRPRPGNSRP